MSSTDAPNKKEICADCEDCTVLIFFIGSKISIWLIVSVSKKQF